MPELLRLPSPTPGLGQYDLQGKTAGEHVLSYTIKIILKILNSFFPKMKKSKKMSKVMSYRKKACMSWEWPAYK